MAVNFNAKVILTLIRPVSINRSFSYCLLTLAGIAGGILPDWREAALEAGFTAIVSS